MILAIILIALIVFGLFYSRNRQSEVKIIVLGEYSNRNLTASEDAYRAIEGALNYISDEERIYILEKIDIADYENMDKLKEAIMDKGTDIVMGPTTSSQFLKSRDALEDLKIPVFLTSVSTDLVHNIDDNIFRLTDTLAVQVDAMSRAVATRIKGGNITIYYSSINKGYSEPYAFDLKEKLMAEGKEVTVKYFDSLELKSAREFLISSDSADGFVVIAGPNQAGIVAQLLDVNNPQVPIIFPTWSKDERTIEYSKNVRNEMYILSSPEPQSFNEYEATRKSLEESKIIVMNSSVYFGYETAYFVNHVVSETQSTKLKDIKAFVHNLESYQGNYNIFTFNSTGDGGRGYTLMRIGKENFEFVEALN